MLIFSKKDGGKIEFAIEKLIDGKRLLQVHRRYEDGSEGDEWSEMPHSDRPLLFIPNPMGDVDDIYLRDLVQSFYGRAAAERIDKPDVTNLYHEFVAQRAAEHKGQRQFASAKIQETT